MLNNHYLVIVWILFNMEGLLPWVCFQRIPLAASSTIRCWRELGLLFSTGNSITPSGSMVALLCLVVARSGHPWESPNHSNLLVPQRDKEETHGRRQELHHFVEWKAFQVKRERKARGWLQTWVIKQSKQGTYTEKEKYCGQLNVSARWTCPTITPVRGCISSEIQGAQHCLLSIYSLISYIHFVEMWQ